MIEIHLSARNNFNAKADALVPLLKVMPRQTQGESVFSPDMPMAATITDKEIVGEVKESIGDHKGRTSGRFFVDNSVRIGMVGGDYQKLIALAESIQRLPSVRSQLSQEFVEDAIFSWIKERLQGAARDIQFFSYLENLASESVKVLTVYVPISSMVVDEPFDVFGITVENMSKKLVDEFSSVTEENSENKEDADKFFEKFRMDFQGRAVVTARLECEPGHAQAVALETAKNVADLLGIYSGAVLVPDIKSASRIKGTEHIDQCTVISRDDNGALQVTSKIMDQGSARYWRVGKADIGYFREAGLDVLSEIYTNKSPTGFEESILNMAYLYSKAAFSADPMEKLICMLSALESMLLKNESEPIQQNLAERMAILSANELDKRKKIVKNVKAVYGLRSRYLHHGHSSSELEQITEFFGNVWVFFVGLVRNSKSFKTKDEFLCAIDDHKLS